MNANHPIYEGSDIAFEATFTDSNDSLSVPVSVQFFVYRDDTEIQGATAATINGYVASIHVSGALVRVPESRRSIIYSIEIFAVLSGGVDVVGVYNETVHQTRTLTDA